VLLPFPRDGEFRLELESEVPGVIKIADPARLEYIQRILSHDRPKHYPEFESSAIRFRDFAALGALRNLMHGPAHLHAADLLPLVGGCIDCYRGFRNLRYIAAVNARWRGKPVEFELGSGEVEQRGRMRRANMAARAYYHGALASKQAVDCLQRLFPRFTHGKPQRTKIAGVLLPENRVHGMRDKIPYSPGL